MGDRMARLALALCLGSLPLATTLADEAKVELGIANTGTQTFHGSVNIGIPPSQLPAIIAAATKPLEDLTEAQRHELDDIRAKLEVSEGALQSFLRAIGAAAVPPEKQAGQLLRLQIAIRSCSHSSKTRTPAIPRCSSSRSRPARPSTKVTSLEPRSY